MRVNVLVSSILLGATTVLGACADATGAAAGRPVSVSFSTAPSSGALMSITATSGANTVVINKAQIVVARMELERTGASCASDAAAGDDQGDEHECADLTLAPSIVDLPVDASVASALQLTIPAGTYRAMEAKIRAIRADTTHGKGSAAFLTAHPDFAGVSVRVEGTYNGTAFVYTGAPRAEFETEFNPALVVDTARANITVHVDMASWFKDASGALINPASTDPMDRATIAWNIQRSFKAYHDDDRDGHDDAGEHHGG